MPKINIYAGKLQIPLKDENYISKKKPEFKLQSKEELTAILQACLLLYEGVPSYKVEEDVGKSFTGIARFILKKLKGEEKINAKERI